jgi:putative ABC transport system permease protein
LYRPQNQTILLIGTIGLSVILVLHLFFIRSSLVSTIQVSGDDNRPNLIIFDIDKVSVKPIEVYLEENSARVFAPLAIVPMRMHALKGRSVFNWKEDSTHEIPNHVFDREYRVTERGELGENETLLEGEWTGEKTGNRIPISLEENFSEQAELSIGDEVDFNVFGSILKTRVAAIRQVDFTQMREAFTIVFPKGSLEGAPVMYAVSANIPEHINRAEIQNGLINRFRNISVIDLDLVFESISQVTSKIELAIQFMFSFSALTALVVLLNSLFISRFQRLKENATLRTLGAISKNLTRINVYEFFIIGMLAVATGLIISLLISFALLVWLFKVKFAPEMGFSAILLFCTLLLVVVMGVLNSRSLVNVAPMRILKGNE